MQPNTVKGTLIVSTILCVVCSLLVSTAAIQLRPLQQANAINKMRRNILVAAGLWEDGGNIDELFKPVERIYVNLPSRNEETADEDGAINNTVDENYDERKAVGDPNLQVSIPDAIDLGGIRYRAPIAAVYVVKDEAGEVDQFILPINGRGLWSTLYGFLALDAETLEVRGITFYEHAETPGLGGEVDNPKWQAQWPNTVVVNDEGEPILNVTKPGEADENNEIDGLSGATITSNGVENMILYWMGPDGFGPFLDRVRAGEIEL